MLLVLALTVPAAQAADPPPAGPACAAIPRYPLPRESGDLRELSSQLDFLSQERGCLGDAYFHAYRGSVLMALGEYTAAVEPLERALLLQPDLPAAQLDLALAFAYSGEREIAQGMLAQLEQRTDLPAPLRTLLTEQRRRMQAVVPQPAFHNRLQATVMGGGETNLNNAPAVSQITLTLPNGGGDVTLPLAPSSLPRSGGAVMSSVQWQAVRPSGEALWMVQGEARARVTSERATTFLQGDVTASWLQAPEARRQWILRTAATWLHFGGHDLLRSTRASAQYQVGGVGSGELWPALLGGAPCRPALGLELDRRHFPQTPELDGLYRGVVGAVACPGLAGRDPRGPTLFNIQVRAGADRPAEASRPGGVQRRGELRAQWDLPLGSPWKGVLGPGRVSLLGSLARQLDTSGYSPLLQDNAVRQTSRYALQAEASFSLGGGLMAVGSAEAANQHSNLPAFTGRQRSLYLGMRWELM